MKVHELLSLLQAADPDAEVRLAIRAHSVGPMPYSPTEYDAGTVLEHDGVVYVAEDGKAGENGVLLLPQEKRPGPGW